VEEAAVAAIRAGSDLIEICHSPELILRSYEALISEAEKSAAFRKVLLAAARQSTRKRARLYARALSPIPNATNIDSLRSSICQFNETVAGILKIAEDAAPRSSSPAEAS
jgi:beta-N-acetylhexosaminidase